MKNSEIFFDNILSENLICIIKNSFELINKLNNINNILETYVFDFEDLYNSIDFSDLKVKVTDFFKYFNNRNLNMEQFENIFNLVVNEN